MEFQLPSVLQKKLTPYDEVRRKVAAEKQRIINKAKRPFHLGLPPVDHLIPHDVLPKNYNREDIIKRISSMDLSYRYMEESYPPSISYGEAVHTNGKPVTFKKTDRLVHNTQNIRIQRRILIYHFEGMWTCLWIPHTNKYVYGYSFAFRDTISNGRRFESYVDHHDHGVKTVAEGDNSDKMVFLKPNQYNDERNEKMKALGDKAYWGYSWKDCLPVKVGKTNWRYKTVYVTKEMIKNGHDYDVSLGVFTSRQIESWHNKSGNLHSQLKDWRQVLRQSLPYWKSSDGYHRSRYDDNMFNRLFPEQNTLGYVIKNNYEKKQKNWNHGYNDSKDLTNKYLELDPMKKWDVTSLKALMFRLTNKEPLDLYERRHNIGHTLWKEDGWIEQPYFRKMLHFALKHSENRLYQSADQSMHWVTTPIARMLHMIEWVDYILTIWPDTPVDYFQNYEKYLLKVTVPTNMKDVQYYRSRTSITEDTWLQTKMEMLKRKREYFRRMPVKTFFEFVKKRSDEYDIEGHKSSYDFKTTMNDHICDFREWGDTVNLMDDILGNQYKDKIGYGKEDAIQEIDRPRRWRLTEIHDHLMGIQWKSNNEDFGLPQDLFSKPIKVTWQQAFDGIFYENYDRKAMWTDHENSVISFFQPITSHQLADWGRAVRNCVGNSSYASAINKKRYFIVLAMVDHKPRYTIQLKLSDGVLVVDQIADIGNRRLTDEEKNFVEKSIAYALQHIAEEDPNYQPEEESK
jgi:hypothetical protein